jgi:Xaa-Pro aminopeptidase
LDAEQTKTFALMKEIYLQALDAWRPGRRIVDIARDVLEVVHRYHAVDPLEGQFIGHNLGYEMVERQWLGIGCPSDLTLETNMVVAPEWFIVTPYGPMLYEENFVVGEKGLERLTDFPRELQVIDR